MNNTTECDNETSIAISYQTDQIEDTLKKLLLDKTDGF